DRRSDRDRDLPESRRRFEQSEEQADRETGEKAFQLGQRMEERSIRERAVERFVGAPQPEGEEEPRQDAEPRQDRTQRKQHPPRLARDTHAQAKKWGVQGGARSPLVEAAQLPDLEVCNG